MSVDVIDPSSNPAWHDFVSSQEAAGIFHHPAWISLLRDQYKYRTIAFCLRRGDAIVAGIPFCEVTSLSGRGRLVCMPFSDHCGPIGSCESDVERLLGHVCSEARRTGAEVQVRAMLPSDRFLSSSSHLLHILNIERPSEDLMKSFKPRVQRPLKKAMRGGVTTEFRTDAEGLDVFWNLHLKTRRRQGVPIQPRRYFELLHKHIIARQLGFIGLCRYQQRYIGAAVFCKYKKVATYKYGASDPAFAHVSPMYPLLWEAMNYSRGLGLSIFDFGRTSQNNPGLAQFKSGWSGEEKELQYSYFPSVPSTRIFSVANTWIMQPVIRNSPPIVCRVAGEVLYKYFGS
jgi:hypothetical protein